MILVVLPSLLALANNLIWGPLSTPPKTATLAILNGAPSIESVSCVCKASSRVGETTRTVTVGSFGFLGLDAKFESGESSNRANAGIPNASVFPLPVSAIPTTSWPFSAGGHVHACIGVGSLKPAKADCSLAGIVVSSWEKDIIGGRAGWVGGVLIVMEWVVRKVWITPGEGMSDDGVGIDEDASARVGVDVVDGPSSVCTAVVGSVLRFFFFSFLRELRCFHSSSVSRFRFSG